MRNIIFYISLLSVIVIGCSRPSTNNHIGERQLSDTEIQIDSIVINADSTSLRGNFVMMDSSLMFVDMLYCKIFEFSLNDGTATNTYSNRGQGPNEMIGIMYGSVIHPADTSMWIIDSSFGVYEFTPSNGQVKFTDRIDFSRNNRTKGDYSSVSSYGVMEMSDFGLTLNQINDSTILFPVSIMNRQIEKVESNRYKHGYIFGLIDSRSQKVSGLSGHFPEYYTSNPLPFFEFFDHTIDYKNSRIYASFAPDSSIYCLDLNGDVINSFGFEPKGVNRDYTKGYETTFDTAGKDMAHVGSNTGLYFDEENELLFRISMTDFASGRTIMQIYKDNNLIIEKEMPNYLKFLGKHNGSYYGVRFLPQDDGDNAHFTLYKFAFDKK